jgi:hypothetical protein
VGCGRATDCRARGRGTKARATSGSRNKDAASYPAAVIPVASDHGRASAPGDQIYAPYAVAVLKRSCAGPPPSSPYPRRRCRSKLAKLPGRSSAERDVARSAPRNEEECSPRTGIGTAREWDALARFHFDSDDGATTPSDLKENFVVARFHGKRCCFPCPNAAHPVPVDHHVIRSPPIRPIASVTFYVNGCLSHGSVHWPGGCIRTRR